MTDRTRIRRLPEKAVDDVAVLHAILDAARVAYVGFADDDGRPVVIPTVRPGTATGCCSMARPPAGPSADSRKASTSAWP